MQSLHLGPLKDYITELIWEIVLADCFATKAATEDKLIDKSVELIRSRLIKFYAANPGQFTEYQDLQPSMIGRKTARSLKIKAAESKGVL